MHLNQTLIIAIGSLLALCLGGFLIWLVRRSSYAEGIAVAEATHLNAVTGAIHEGDTIVAAKRDPSDVLNSMHDGSF